MHKVGDLVYYKISDDTYEIVAIHPDGSVDAKLISSGDVSENIGRVYKNTHIHIDDNRTILIPFKHKSRFELLLNET